jgi:actin-related protein 8
MKRDDQILPLRLQAEANRERMIRKAKDKDRALARTGDTDVPGLGEDGEFGAEEGEDDELNASKIIVIHLGSQNMRIGLASDALPKTVPMAIALKTSVSTESEMYDARPRRDADAPKEELQFGEEFSKKYQKMCNDLKVDMRANKRKVLPNSKELVVNYNKRTPPETIPEHNDPVRVEWTEPKSDTVFAGMAALRIPDDSNPKFRLSWPIQHGWLNERDYRSRELMHIGLTYAIEEAIRNELGLSKASEWKQYSCNFVIPDLYDKPYVEELLTIAMRDLEFARVTFVQESIAASFGAGYTNACIVDIGAQKTSISCVEDGLILEDSRINLKYGGYDTTEAFIKMMLYDHFPYQEISVQLYNFHLRLPSEATRKYQFKTYDEVILAPMGLIDPSIFDHSTKLAGRRKLIDRSYNFYDPDAPDDPVSAAQTEILTSIEPSLGITSRPAANGEVSTPMKEKPQPFNLLNRLDPDSFNDSTPASTSGSPAPEGVSTPNANGVQNNGTGSPGPSNGMFKFGAGSPAPPNTMFAKSVRDLAEERDRVLPIAPLDTAICTSIYHAARGDEKRLRDLFGGIMVIGGGAKTPGFGPFLEERLKMKRPDLADKILVGTSPREMDGQVVAWKGASVYSKLGSTHDTWISQVEFERHGFRAVYGRVPWQF